MKACGGEELWFHSFLMEVTGQLHASAALPQVLIEYGVWLGRADMIFLEKRKMRCPVGIRPALRLVTILPTLCLLHDSAIGNSEY